MTRLQGLPFQWAMTLRMGAVVLALTGAFLWFVLGRAQGRIEQSGRENFRHLASHAFDQFEARTQSHLHYLDILAQLLPQLTDLDAESTVRALGFTFLTHPGANALAITSPSDDMLYFLKHDIEAPPESRLTIGRRHPQADDGRAIDATYYAADGRVVERRHFVVPARDGPQSEWHQGALRLRGPYMSPPHRIPGRDSLGISLAVPSDGSVVKLVTPIELLDDFLAGLNISANGAALLLDDRLRVVAANTRGALAKPEIAIDSQRLVSLGELGDPVLSEAAGATARLAENETSMVQLGGSPYLLAWHGTTPTFGTRYRLLLIAPLSDLSIVAESARREAWLIALAGLVVLLPLSWFGAARMAHVLQQLVHSSQRIARMDFTAPEQLHSAVREVQALVQAQDVMRDALADHARALERVSAHLARLVDTGIRLGREKHRKALLNEVLSAACNMAGASAAIVFIRHDNLLQPVATLGLPYPERLVELDLNQVEAQRRTIAANTVLHGATIVIDDIQTDSREELQGFREVSHHFGLDISTAVSLPLRTPDRRIIGAMQVVNACDPETGAVAAFSATQLRYLEALASQAAVALDNQQLITSQTQLLETLVRTLGDAVDAKSAYTGRHCARVPELAMMLAREAHAESSGPLATFAFRSENEWREFRTGAWLHDCGKITSPEHVMDKATKLETVYNRLHEVRMRFEVLLRDARIEALQARLDGTMDAAAAEAFVTRREKTLRDDFAFIAGCNVGGEKMAAADIARIRDIGRQQWWRHFDDRLGLSHEELERRQRIDEPALPAVETLLADQPWHRIERPDEQRALLTQGFRMKVPELLYHHGELYNLCVERGTLNAEERFKINEHIIHTIRMLEGANFPPHLRRVPEYAGTHHETLDGKGYPRGLTAAELSIPARIMSIADIFEALTASDRLYKPAKPLSESLSILQRMKQKGLIDPDLFELFLRKGVYLRYAQRFLTPEQMDVTDVTPYLS